MNILQLVNNQHDYMLDMAHALASCSWGLL